jgi:hypothetical protein
VEQIEETATGTEVLSRIRRDVVLWFLAFPLNPMTEGAATAAAAAGSDRRTGRSSDLWRSHVPDSQK